MDRSGLCYLYNSCTNYKKDIYNDKDRNRNDGWKFCKNIDTYDAGFVLKCKNYCKGCKDNKNNTMEKDEGGIQMKQEIYELLKKSFNWYCHLSDDGYFGDNVEEPIILQFKKVFMSDDFKDMFIKDEKLKDLLYELWLRESFYNTDEYNNLDYDHFDDILTYRKEVNKFKDNYRKKHTKEDFYK